MIHEPKKLTEALDVVINEVKKLEASTNENKNKLYENSSILHKKEI